MRSSKVGSCTHTGPALNRGTGQAESKAALVSGEAGGESCRNPEGERKEEFSAALLRAVHLAVHKQPLVSSDSSLGKV